jgi:hypothetical protein
MSKFDAILLAWIVTNAVILALLVIRRASHLRHRLYCTGASSVPPALRDLVASRSI